MYILDTNTLIYFFKGMGKVHHTLLKTPPSEIGIPTIVLYEIEVGIAKSNSPQKRIQQLTSLTTLINIISFDEKEAKTAAIIRTDLEKIGTPIGPYDILIAATALSHNDTLVTHNTKEFERIPNLKLEDWY
jgi:tRNA(fMet)-specific endonuclease VapC